MKALIRQKIRQFLIHSFLYYRLDDSIISDRQYDLLCKDLKRLLEEHPNSEVQYRELVEPLLGSEASGFSIRCYPPPIISSALHLLYQKRFQETMSFSEFLERNGYRLET